ncbi:hypothetical protein [Vibrio owensii]|uniref:hypothetical protein n=1 Tax=Vibrio owensii TaxID=696485 RepID=UPI002FEF4644
MFFFKDSNSEAINSFLRKVQSNTNEQEDSVETKRLNRVTRIVSSIKRNPQLWDKRCTFNINYIGDQYISALRNYSSTNPKYLNLLYTMSFRFLCEFDFYSSSNEAEPEEIEGLIYEIQNDDLKLDSDVSSKLIYASYAMPARIAKDIVNSEEMDTAKGFEKKLIEAKDILNGWDDEIKKRLEATDRLEKRLKEYESAFNFVGLSDGFMNLEKKKVKERSLLLFFMFLLGTIIVTPLAIKFNSSLQGVGENPFSWAHLGSYIPLLSLEIVLIYFFRITLHHYKEVKTQIVQIELRQTLCQFIQSYADYASKIRKADPSSLEKFESLIFSGIMSDSEKLPSTFDGMEQIGALLKNIKAK